MRIFSSVLFTLLLSLAAQPAAAVVFKIATLSPDGSTWMKLLRSRSNSIPVA